MTTTGEGEDAWVPSACTLPSRQQPLRVAEFDRFFLAAVPRVSRTGPTTLDLHLASDSALIARDLADRESRCCSFIRFDFAPDAEGVLMRIGVPDEHVDVLDAVEARIASTPRPRHDE